MMAGEKFHNKRFYAKRTRRMMGLLLIGILILLLSVGGTVAFLTTWTNSVTNTFDPAELDCEVQEEFDKTIKKNVSVKNTGNSSVYIRVKLLFNWYAETEDKLVAKEAWAQTITPANSDWVTGADGYYYYTKPVLPGKSTANLINSITLEPDPVSRARQGLEIIASCIQADPDDAVKQAWGNVNGGSVTNVSDAGVLSVTGAGITQTGG